MKQVFGGPGSLSDTSTFKSISAPISTAEMLSILHMPKTMAWHMVVIEIVFGTMT